MRAFLVALFYAGAAGYRAPAARPRRGPRPLTMVLERARPDVSDKTGFVGLPGLRVQGLDGVNQMKLESDYLRHPLVEDLADMETISISHDSYNLLKFHGSYQQDDREKRKKGAEKAWQFMLRLKVPSGECPGPLYLVLDDLCERFGQRDLRMTTRQAFQIHGISKANLKHVIRTIMEAGSTTIGGGAWYWSVLVAVMAGWRRPPPERIKGRDGIRAVHTKRRSGAASATMWR